MSVDFIQWAFEQGSVFALAVLAMWMLREIYRERVRDLVETKAELMQLLTSVRDELVRSRQALENNTVAMTKFTQNMDHIIRLAERMERRDK